MKKVTKKTISAAQSHLSENWTLRKSESSWAGGNHYVSVAKGKSPSCSGGSQKVWSRNGKWSGNDSYVHLTATRAAFLAYPTLTARDGAIILDCENIGNREQRVVFVKQGKGFDITTATGWMIKGYLSTKRTVDAARAEVAEARQKTLALAMKRHQEKISFKKIWVSVDDSIAAGNCRAITMEVYNQVKRVYGEVGALRADALLLIRDDIYSRRAIKAAQNRVK